jgi:hypothetical protein
MEIYTRGARAQVGDSRDCCRADAAVTTSIGAVDLAHEVEALREALTAGAATDFTGS